MPATGANTILIAGVSTGLSLESQTPQTNILQEVYWETIIRLLKAIQGGITNKYIKSL